MSEYKDIWESSIDKALHNSDIKEGREEYVSQIGDILSCFNTLIDLAGDKAPVVFSCGIISRYEDNLYNNEDLFDETLVKRIKHYGKLTIGKNFFPEDYDALAVHLFRAVHALATYQDMEFSVVLKSFMVDFVAKIADNYYPVHGSPDKSGSSQNDTVKDEPADNNGK